MGCRKYIYFKKNLKTGKFVRYYPRRIRRIKYKQKHKRKTKTKIISEILKII